MSYAQRKTLSGNPALSIVLTVVVVGSLLYTIVTGLAYNVIKQAADNLKVVDVEDQPPPPEQPPPPPPKDIPELPPPPVAMAPVVQTPVVQAPVFTTPTPPPVITPQAPPAPPPPPPAAKVTKAQSAKGSLQSLINSDDYPQDSIRNEETGRVVVRLSIGADGRVSDCSVVSSSGHRSLDSATCRILKSRARYTPARLSNGQPTTDTDTAAISWQLSG